MNDTCRRKCKIYLHNRSEFFLNQFIKLCIHQDSENFGQVTDVVAAADRNVNRNREATPDYKFAEYRQSYKRYQCEF